MVKTKRRGKGRENMKKKLKLIIMIGILAIGILLLTSNQSQAVLQANPNTQYKTSRSLKNWISDIRGMEDVNGTMGLAEEKNESLTSTKETTNNIDVHCMKTTEYGAMAILTTSGYGNPSNERYISSSTGNNTGVILDTKHGEWTAGIIDSSKLSGVDARYYDLYTNDANITKVGDALGRKDASNPGCAGWHSAGYATWPNNQSAFGYAFARGVRGIFTFEYGCRYSSSNSSIGGFKEAGTTRAVVVCGRGL